ncbi:MAG: glutathione S-transferase N-terminal domain-containing protein [Granulosicoccus sp.]|nr:glutathione S-transferase N-terminal domain-containing protein [Granulosicoccus sp.]
MNATSSTTARLYDYWRSTASYQVRIALALANIDYERSTVDLLKQEHRNPEHLKRNPQGLVPVLTIDGRNLRCPATLESTNL